jgi:hypothetical protein
MTFFRIFRRALRHRPRSGQRVHRRGLSLRENWWVILFFAGSAGVYWQGICEKESIYHDLQTRMSTAQEQLCFASFEREELLRQIRSQSDPEWIELVLMKRLGLVPEGQTKVYFEKAQP